MLTQANSTSPSSRESLVHTMERESCMTSRPAMAVAVCREADRTPAQEARPRRHRTFPSPTVECSHAGSLTSEPCGVIRYRADGMLLQSRSGSLSSENLC